MQKTALILVINIFLLSACQHAETTGDNNTQFYPTDDIVIGSKIHKKHYYRGNTYQWGGANIEINDPNGVWNAPEFDYDTYISSAIEKELAKFGLSESDSAEITFSYGINLNMAAIKLKNYVSDDGNETNERLVFQIPESAFSIIISNKATKEILWTGWAKSDYQSLEPEIATKRIDFVIREIIKRLPRN